MTDQRPPDAATAERLARLQQRRAATPGEAAAPSGNRSGRSTPKASPAANSKIVATGASAIAMLSMIAVFGHQAETASESAPQVPVNPLAPASSESPIAVADTGSATIVVAGTDDAPTVAALAPIPAPQRVQLAVPAPRRVVVAVAPAPRPSAPARGSTATAVPAPAPAPAPAATSKGS